MTVMIFKFVICSESIILVQAFKNVFTLFSLVGFSKAQRIIDQNLEKVFVQR